jgi:hypothetical protein
VPSQTPLERTIRNLFGSAVGYEKLYIRIWKKMFVVYFKIPLGTNLKGEECSEEAQGS